MPKVGMNYVALMYSLLLLGHNKPLGSPIPYGCQPCRFKVHEGVIPRQAVVLGIAANAATAIMVSKPCVTLPPHPRS